MGKAAKYISKTPPAFTSVNIVRFVAGKSVILALRMRSHQQGIGFRLQRSIGKRPERKALACLYCQCRRHQRHHDGKDADPSPRHKANLFNACAAMAAAVSKYADR